MASLSDQQWAAFLACASASLTRYGFRPRPVAPPAHTDALAQLMGDTGCHPLDLRPIPTPPEAQTLLPGCGCLTVRRRGRLIVYRPYRTDQARLWDCTELHAGLVQWLEDAPVDDPERPAVLAQLRRLRAQRVELLERLA